ncbi:hypothetical protein KHF85_13385 [Xanthomonas translucens pv. graminis]|uniref:hypothetical protein n=1 Tax=Xanthomonas graminis TaxID=3390026 RepID=UPI002540B03C|nr:hypothetical protein [Xanthomonas translucens]WIH03857.1 hypothetical protein KHF85_13385 [Xanthomonas translucens pv. graminis]
MVSSILEKKAKSLCVVALAALMPCLASAQAIVQHEVHSHIVSVSPRVHSLILFAEGGIAGCYPVRFGGSTQGPGLNSAVSYQVQSSGYSCSEHIAARSGNPPSFQPPSDKNLIFFRIDAAGGIHITDH